MVMLRLRWCSIQKPRGFSTPGSLEFYGDFTKKDGDGIDKMKMNDFAIFIWEPIGNHGLYQLKKYSLHECSVFTLGGLKKRRHFTGEMRHLGVATLAGMDEIMVKSDEIIHNQPLVWYHMVSLRSAWWQMMANGVPKQHLSILSCFAKVTPGHELDGIGILFFICELFWSPAQLSL